MSGVNGMSAAEAARTATGRVLRRVRLDPRYPVLDLWVDARERLEDLGGPSPTVQVLPRWLELEGPLTYLLSVPDATFHEPVLHGTQLGFDDRCRCRACLDAVREAALARYRAGRRP